MAKRLLKLTQNPTKLSPQLAARADHFGSWLPKELAFFLALAFMGSAAALVLTEPWAPRPEPLPAIKLGDATVAIGGPQAESPLKIARRRLKSMVTLQVGSTAHRLSWAALGAKMDVELLERLPAEFARFGSPAVRYFNGHQSGAAVPQIPMPVTLSSARAIEALMQIKEIVDKSPKNARFQFTSGAIAAAEEGITLNVYATLNILREALASGLTTIEAATYQVRPEITKDKLQDIQAKEVMGFFETRFSRLPKDRDRTHNVLHGADKLDGQIIMPGQVFSFNDTLGDRTQAHGFRYAPVIAGGEIVEGMGGGTCQVASTLYAASFFAGLVVTSRQPHSRPSSYIKLGLDATVSYPDKDLRLKNPFSFPVVLHFSSNDGKLRAEIRGQTRPYTVTFLRKVIGTDPFPVKYIDNDNLERGQEVVTQKGIPGYTVQRYQLLDGKKIGYRHQTIDTYPPTAQIVHRGTAPAGALGEAAAGPKPDGHNAYRASNHLRMVQGLGSLWYEQSRH